MPEYSTILRSLTQEKFAEVLTASSRKARETYFHRHGVRAAKHSTRLTKPGSKNEERTLELYRVLQERDDKELAEEMLRNFLLTKRSMLAAALDHLGIPHQQGLTESEDVTKFEKLSAKEITALVKTLSAVASQEDVVIYLKFMGANEVDRAAPKASE